MDIPAALSIVQQSIGIAKELRDIDTELDKATIKAKMADLYSDLADVKMALTDAQIELRVKDKKIVALETKAIDEKFARYEMWKPEYGDPVYRIKSEERLKGEPDHLICPNCKEDGKLSFLTTKAVYGDRHSTCNSCNSEYHSNLDNEKRKQG